MSLGSVLTTVLVLLLPGAAFADHAPLLFPTWKNNSSYQTTTRPSVRAVVGYPSNADNRQRVKDGFSQWNGVGEPLQYSFNTTDLPSFDRFSQCAPRMTVAVFWGGIDGGGGKLGTTGNCTIGNSSISSIMTFDQREEWCYGSGNCYDGVGGSGQGADIDLWSVATHESGHASGLDHLNGSSSVCANNSSQATMCPVYSPGSERLRTLAGSDVDSLRYYY